MRSVSGTERDPVLYLENSSSSVLWLWPMTGVGFPFSRYLDMAFIYADTGLMGEAGTCGTARGICLPRYCLICKKRIEYHIPVICLYLQLSKLFLSPDLYSGCPTLPQTMRSVYKGWWLRQRFRKKMKSVMAEKLTHGDHISLGIIHTFVVFGGPLETYICPGLQVKMLVAQFFPLRHEKLEGWDSPRQNRCHMCGHNLLNLMRGL